MSERDINANIDALRNFSEQMAGVDLLPREKEAVQILASCGLELLRCFLLDINKIAYAATHQAFDK